MFGWLRPRPPLGARGKSVGGDSTPATRGIAGGRSSAVRKYGVADRRVVAQRAERCGSKQPPWRRRSAPVSRLASISPICRSTRGHRRRPVNQAVRRARKGLAVADEGTGRDSQTAVAELVHAMAGLAGQRAISSRQRWRSRQNGGVALDARRLRHRLCQHSESRRTLPARIWGYALACSPMLAARLERIGQLTCIPIRRSIFKPACDICGAVVNRCSNPPGARLKPNRDRLGN